MNVLLNGRSTPVDDAVSLAALLQSIGVDASRRGVAVAVNDDVVPRSAWAERRLAEADRVEVIQATVGG